MRIVNLTFIYVYLANNMSNLFNDKNSQVELVLIEMLSYQILS